MKQVGFEEFPERVPPGTPAASLLRLYAKTNSGIYIKDSGGSERRLDVDEQIIVFSKTGVLSVSSGAIRLELPWAVTLLGVTATVGTAPTGSSLIIDVNKNGTTIFTTQGNRPTIAISGNRTTTAPTPDVTAIDGVDDYLTVDIDQIGSTVAGSDLTVVVRYKRT